MSRIYRFVFLLPLLVLMCSCHPADKYQDIFWVIADNAKIYEKPAINSTVLKEVKFGSNVYCRGQNPSYTIPRGWIEAKSDNARGFVEKKAIADEKLNKEIQDLINSSKDLPAQAAGLTKKKASLRLKPDKNAVTIKTFKRPDKAEVLERIIVTIGEKEKTKRQVWYKIRVGGGLVGFVAANNLQLTPPVELAGYTQVRTPVSWYKLREKEDPETKEKGIDYLVTYSSVGSDVATDFTRIELYTYSLKQKEYATALARSALYGILPVKVTDEGDGKRTIEIREHPKGDMKKVHVIKYSFPSPIKVVKDYVE